MNSESRSQSSLYCALGQRGAHGFVYELRDHAAHLLAEIFAHEDAAALVVDDAALLVHDLVVLEHVLAAHEVELLDLLLRPLHHVAEHLGLERLAV